MIIQMERTMGQVEKKTKNEVANLNFDNSLQSAGDTLEKVDLRIPKMVLVQQMTKRSFNTNNVPVGNYVDSIDKNDLGDSIDIFVMNDTKLWELKYKVGDKEEYLGSIDYSPANANLRDNPRIPEELTKKANEKNVTVDMLSQINMINRFFVLKLEDVLNGTAFPYAVDFKRASYNAGVQLKNTFYRMKRLKNLPSYAYVYTLGSTFVQDEHEYYIKSVSPGRMINESEVEAVESWVREVTQNKSNYTTDEAEEEANDNNTKLLESDSKDDTIRF